MKNLKIILIAAFSLSLIATSCKKEKTPEPAPAAPTSVTAPTELALSVVEVSDISGTFSSPSIKVLDESGNVDTTIMLSIDTTVVSTSFPTGEYCLMTNIHKTTVSKVLTSATSFYRVQFYSGTTVVRTVKITQNNIQDEGLTGGISIATGSVKRVVVYK